MTTSINVPDYGKIFATADSFDELRNISARQVRDGYWALVAGATSITDGLGGIFVWNDHSTAEDDDETVIRPTESSGAGRWVAVAVGKLGAVGPQGLIGNTGAKGDPGSAGNVAATLAQLKAVAITADTFLYDGAPFRWTVGNFMGQADDTNIVQANGTPLSTGAWIRQGADKVAATGGGTVSDALAGQLSIRQAGAMIGSDIGEQLQAALTAAAASGDELLIPGGEYNSNIALACNAVRIRCLGPVKITYTGSTHIASFFTITATNDVSVTGKLSIDCQNKANVGLEFTNTSATAVDLVLDDIAVENCRMVAGGPAIGSGGIWVLGNFNQVQGRQLAARNIGRAAGTVVVGTTSTTGVQIARRSGYAPRIVRLGNVDVDQITCDDASGSAGRTDVDGLAIFQNDVIGAVCQVDSLVSRNALGRAFKCQGYRSPLLRTARVYRDIEGIRDGSVEINFQYGEGEVGDLLIEYAGDAVAGNGVIPVSFFTSDTRTSYGRSVVRRMQIIDNTETGGLDFLIDMSRAVNAVPSRLEIGSIEVVGNPVGHIIRIGGNGASNQLDITLSSFRGGITHSVIQTNAYPNQVRGVFSGVVNTGSVVPLIVREDLTSLGSEYGRLIDGGNNRGIAVNRGVFSGTPGLAPMGSQFVLNSMISGRVPLYENYALNGTTVELPPFGYTASSGEIIVILPETGERGVYQTSAGDNAIVAIKATSGVAVSSDGTEPAGGLVRLWKTSSGSRVTFKATTDRFVAITAEV